MESVSILSKMGQDFGNERFLFEDEHCRVSERRSKGGKIFFKESLSRINELVKRGVLH